MYLIYEVIGVFFEVWFFYFVEFEFYEWIVGDVERRWKVVFVYFFNCFFVIVSGNYWVFLFVLRFIDFLILVIFVVEIGEISFLEKE